MDQIDTLNWYITYGPPQVEIAAVSNDNNEFTVDVFANNLYRYNLLRSTEIVNPSWVVVDTALVTSADTITLIDNSLGSFQKAFYKVQAVIP